MVKKRNFIKIIQNTHESHGMLGDAADEGLLLTRFNDEERADTALLHAEVNRKSQKRFQKLQSWAANRRPGHLEWRRSSAPQIHDKVETKIVLII